MCISETAFSEDKIELCDINLACIDIQLFLRKSQRTWRRNIHQHEVVRGNVVMHYKEIQ